ncbi:MAG: hypothetical protein C4339_02465 [Nitrososphaerota archaeon]
MIRPRWEDYRRPSALYPCSLCGRHESSLFLLSTAFWDFFFCMFCRSWFKVHYRAKAILPADEREARALTLHYHQLAGTVNEYRRVTLALSSPIRALRALLRRGRAYRQWAEGVRA